MVFHIFIIEEGVLLFLYYPCKAQWNGDGISFRATADITIKSKNIKAHLYTFHLYLLN